MKKKNLNKKMLIKICLVLLVLYTIYILFEQQFTLNEYSKTAEDLSIEIEEKVAEKEDLQAQKENIDSLEFIEAMAREKLDMYYPNEKIYVDSGK